MQQRDQEEQKVTEAVHKLVLQIDKDPDNYLHYYELATLLLDLKNYEQAEELLLKALGLFGNQDKLVHDKLVYGLGNVYYAADEYDKAIAQFQLINDENLKTDAFMMIAQSYMAKGDSNRALVFALYVQGKRPKDIETNLLVADNLLASGNFSQAGNFYDQVISVDKTNGMANFNRGLVAMVNGEPYNHYFEIAKQSDPQYFKNSQQKLADIETFIKTNEHKDN